MRVFFVHYRGDGRQRGEHLVFHLFTFWVRKEKESLRKKVEKWAGNLIPDPLPMGLQHDLFKRMCRFRCEGVSPTRPYNRHFPFIPAKVSSSEPGGEGFKGGQLHS